MDTYTYPESSALYERASAVIPGGVPGHLGPAEGVFIPLADYPIYASRSEGGYFWDLDGNRFVDLMCAYGPNILGYNHPVVEEAAARQAAKLNTAVLPGPIMVDLAELLVDTVAQADWAFFAKNGGDVTTFAVMIARAATGRSKVLLHKGNYHGVAGWTQKYGNPGITNQDISNNIYVDFGDIEAVRRAVAENKGKIACFMSTPYHHPVFEDNRTPPEGYWKEVREICTREGIVLAIDDVRAGFRLDVRGSDAYYGFKADLMCFCKALANGHNISAITGIDALKDAAAGIMYTDSYWSSAVPMAAAHACVTTMREIDSAAICLDLGQRLNAGLAEVSARHGFDFRISGEASMPFWRIAGFNGIEDPNFLLHQQFIGESVRRGVFATNHHNHFMNTAITQADIDFVLDVADEAFAVVASKSRAILAKGT